MLLPRLYERLLADFLNQTGGRHADVCRGLAAMCMERERLESTMVAGEPIDTDLLVRVAGEIRRSCERIGIVADADDEPGPDATDEVLRHIRAATEAA